MSRKFGSWESAHRGKVSDSVQLPLMKSWSKGVSGYLISFFIFHPPERICPSFSDIKIQGLAKGLPFKQVYLCCLDKKIFLQCLIFAVLSFIVLFFLCCTALLAEIKVLRVPDLPLTQCQCCCGHLATQHQVNIIR